MRNLEIKNNASLATCGRERQSGRCLLPESGADAPTVLSAVYTDSTPAKNRQADVPQYGRSMIEMLGVLAIIGVLSVGGIAGYSKAMMKYRINKTIEQITLIAGNVRTFFSSQKNYDDLSTNVIKKAKLVPDEMWNEDKTALVNAFGTGVEVGSSNGFDKSFQILYHSPISPEACIELVTQDWSSVNINVIYLGTQKQKYLLPPISLDDAVTYCEDIDNEHAYGITFYVDVDLNDGLTKHTLGLE